MSYEATPDYTWNQRLRGRLRTEMEMEGVAAAMMHAAWMDGDSFPQGLGKLGLIGGDPAGDSLMIQAPMLDLGNTWMGTTSQKIYCTIANQSGSFPTMNSLTSYNAWLTTIANPEAIADSVVYAMVYTFNIVGVISSGLYKLGMDESMTPTFARIGNIQSSVSGGKLNLACNLSDLTSDPSFGAWPNMSNSLLFSSFSMRLNIDLGSMEPEILIGDYSMPAIVFFEDIQYQHPQNTLPVVTGLNVNGLMVSCLYQDAEGDFPLLCEFYPEAGPSLPMHPTSYDFAGGVTYTATLSGPIQNGVLKVSDNLIDEQQYPWSNVAGDDPALAP
ncbi:MAG TPA: T9SS C-terminal target domain-containing protein, partial [Candidatus Cloacimonadota bacterium]|nr:T9SS C-terminal target domain-containing protein [Candidatus Cloacimonadota bacterium]